MSVRFAPVVWVWAVCVVSMAALAVPPDRGDLNTSRSDRVGRLDSGSVEDTGAEAGASDSSPAVSGGGACCLPDRNCVTAVDGNDCQWQGGVFQGSGSTCGVCPAFPSFKVDFLSWVPRSAFPDSSNRFNGSNDAWGYVSPSGREYGIYCMGSGTGFIEVTDPVNPVIVGYVDAENCIWRDAKVFGNHAYIVSECGFGMQIVDLSDIDNGNVTLVKTDTLGGNFFTAHNIAINTDSGFAYTVLNDFVRGLLAIDLSDPVNPTIAGQWDGDLGEGNGIHDIQVVSMDVNGQPKEIAFCANEGRGFYILDVTDKSAMTSLASLTYPNLRYAHQGALSSDGQHFFLGDELDELQDPDVTQTTTYIFNVADLSSPFLESTFVNSLGVIDHNMYVVGDFLFQSNYTAGLRIIDVSDPLNAVEVGFFDTFPESNAQGFQGTWSNYPFLPSGIVLISDIEHGMFVVDPSAAVGGCPLNCNGNGTCVGGVCVCDAGWSGPACDCSTAPCPNDCSMHGTCVCGVCACDPGWRIAADCSVPGCLDDSDCADGNVCTRDQCISSVCDNSVANLYGDMNGDDLITIFDLFCLLDGLNGQFVDCTLNQVDISGGVGVCTADGLVTIFDLFALLDALSGIDPCCGG